MLHTKPKRIYTAHTLDCYYNTASLQDEQVLTGTGGTQDMQIIENRKNYCAATLLHSNIKQRTLFYLSLQRNGKRNFRIRNADVMYGITYYVTHHHAVDHCASFLHNNSYYIVVADIFLESATSCKNGISQRSWLMLSHLQISGNGMDPSTLVLFH